MTTNPETGEVTTTERKPKVVIETVKAPVAGTLSLPTLKDQVVSVGDEVGKVAPGTLSVTGTLTPDQQYRLVGRPDAGQRHAQRAGRHRSTAPGCASAQPPPRAPTPGPDRDGTSASAHRHLRDPGGRHGVPRPRRDGRDHQRHGRRRRRRPDHGGAGHGPDGERLGRRRRRQQREAAPSALGLTDGKNVQITEGLAAGDTILEFIPVPGRRRDSRSTAASNYDPAVCGG